MGRVMIRLRYQSIDGVNKVRSFGALAGARRWAQEWAGADAEVAASGYAISFDGVSKITVIEGATLAELFER
jgi:hypothetical protein